MRLAVLLATLLASVTLLVSAPPALAQQDGGGAFGPLPPAAPTPAPTVDAPEQDDDDVGRITLYIIGAALLVSFAGLAFWITRDARRAIPAGPQMAPPEVLRERDERRQKMERRAKEQARKRQRAARASRKRNR